MQLRYQSFRIQIAQSKFGIGESLTHLQHIHLIFVALTASLAYHKNNVYFYNKKNDENISVHKIQLCILRKKKQ